MDNLLSLYFYELKKNKNKFLLIFILALIFLLASLYVVFFQGDFSLRIFEIKEVIEKILSNKNISKDLRLELSQNFRASIVFTEYLNGIPQLFKVVGALTAVLLSFDISLRNFKKKNKSFYIYSCLPVKIWQIKLSRILCAMSVYIFYLILFSGVSLTITFIQKAILGDFYNSSIVDLSDFVFMLNEGKFALFVTFMYIPVCFAGIQMLTSAFLVEGGLGKNISKKIFSLTIILLIGILMIAILGYIQIVMEIPYILLVIFPIAFLLLFLADVRLSKKKFRGGL